MLGEAFRRNKGTTVLLYVVYVKRLCKDVDQIENTLDLKQHIRRLKRQNSGREKGKGTK
jgi:hypothetical protein